MNCVSLELPEGFYEISFISKDISWYHILLKPHFSIVMFSMGQSDLVVRKNEESVLKSENVQVVAITVNSYHYRAMLNELLFTKIE